MKLLRCNFCGQVFVLELNTPKACDCARSGGYYNADGDTATVWGDFQLMGLNNSAVRTVLFGYPLTDWRGDKVLWEYPIDNGKITVADELVKRDSALAAFMAAEAVA